jgi:hypothetical protein
VLVDNLANKQNNFLVPILEERKIHPILVAATMTGTPLELSTAVNVVVLNLFEDKRKCQPPLPQALSKICCQVYCM